MGLTLRAYTVVWTITAAVVILAGVGFALAEVPTYVVLILFVTFAFCGCVISASVRAPDSNAQLSPTIAGRVVADAATAGFAGVACFGMGTAVGGWMLPIAATLALTSPSACIVIAHRLTTLARYPVHLEPSAAITGSELRDWTDSELYAVWCATNTEISRATQAREAATAVRARQLLLAEIERRHPTQTKMWLSSDSALTGTPPNFLRPR